MELKYNIKINRIVKGISCANVKWTRLTVEQYKGSVLNAAMNLRTPYHLEMDSARHVTVGPMLYKIREEIIYDSLQHNIRSVMDFAKTDSYSYS